MSPRAAGQIHWRQAVGGIFVLCALVAALIALSRWLLLPVDAVEELPEPPAAIVCPDSTVSGVAVSAAELVDCPRVYDGQTISYEGEVVGAVLERGDIAWVQLNDDPYALFAGPLSLHRIALGGNSGIPVAIPVALANEIEHVGSHRVRGDLLAVTGVFRRADPEDGGGVAIRATAGEVSRRGARLAHDVSPRRLWVAAALLALTALLGLVLQRRSAAFRR